MGYIVTGALLLGVVVSTLIATALLPQPLKNKIKKYVDTF